MASFALIEDQKALLLARVANWHEQRLNFRQSAGEWSTVEVFDHLVRTEAAILDVARLGLAHPHRIGLSDHLRTAFLTALFRSQMRVKIPSNVKQIVPGSDLSLPEVRDRWEFVRTDLASFLQTASAHQLRKGIFRHPVGGWMNSSGILNFFSVHIIHHGHQLDRLAAASKI